MDPFEYAMGLISIVVGLALGDMATSLHKLIRHRQTIIWDARVLLAAALIFVLLFDMWYEIWGIRNQPEVLNWFFLLSLIAELIVAFLAASSVLPDDAGAGFDLKQFYDGNSRSLWSIYATFQISYLSHWAYFMLTSGRSGVRMLELVPRLSAPLAIAILLLLWPHNRRLHLVLVSALLLSRIYPHFGERIGG